MTVDRVLTEAADRLMSHGWQKGKGLGLQGDQWSTGPHSLMGSILRVNNGCVPVEEAFEAVRVELRLLEDEYHGSLQLFNEAPGQCVENVVGLLKNAAMRVRMERKGIVFGNVSFHGVNSVTKPVYL